MDEQEVAGLYIAEMHALLPVIQRHLDTLGSAASEEQCTIAAEELARLGSAIADLSAGFHAEDCAQAALVLADCFARAYAPIFRSTELLANCADLLTYLKERLLAMTHHRRVLAPTDEDRLTISRLIATLQQTRKQLAYSLPAEMFAPIVAADTTIQTAPALSTDAPPEQQATAEETFTTTIPQEEQEAIILTEPEQFDTLASAENSYAEWKQATEDFATSSAAIDINSMAALDPLAESNGQLTEEERQLLRSFQNSPVRPGSRHNGASAPFSASSDAIPGAAEMAALSQPGIEVTTPEQPNTTEPSLAASNKSENGVPSGEFALPSVTDEELDFIPPEMKRLFVIETGEDVQDIQRLILNLAQHIDEWTTLSELGRLAHKIKGAASTLGFDALASMSVLFEDVIRAFQAHAVPAEPATIATLTSLLTVIETAVADAAAEQDPEPALLERAQHLRDNLLATYNVGSGAGSHYIHYPEPMPTDAESENEASTTRARVGDVESLLRVEVHRLDELMTQVNSLALNRASFIQMRDDIMKLQSELDQALNRLNVVSHRVADLSPHQLSGSFSTAFSGIQRRPPGVEPPPTTAAQARWDRLELERISEFDQAVRQLHEVVEDATSTSKYLRLALTRLGLIGDEQATIAHDIQRDVMRIRLVRLEDLMPRIQLEARRLASSMGKTISFTIRGQMTEIDRNISEALAEPLLQLVRNAIVHGIESREERLEHGKLETGRVWIHAYYVGSEAVIEVGDDGQGVNPYLLAGSAVALGILDSESAHTMPFSDALDLMFMPGITTFQAAQMVAGRGIGLDEVRTIIQRLKGSIQVQSEQGKGSTFRIRVPISLSIVRTLSVHIAGQPYAVPFSSILQMSVVAPGDLRPRAAGPNRHSEKADTQRQNLVSNPLAPDQIYLRVRLDAPQLPSIQATAKTTDGRLTMPTIMTSNTSDMLYEDVPAFALADILGFESTPAATQLALIVEAGHHRAALLVDQVSDDQEVVIQALPAHLRRHAIRGATVTPDGVVQLLLDLPALVQRTLNGTRPTLPARKRPLPQWQKSAAPRVLVVDDSVSIRGAVELALTRAGFEVQLARDGIEALEMMLVAPPQVMVLDIEMPRLDGFEVLSVIRDTPQFAGVKVVMLTSRAADKHQQQAKKLGAAAYLIKPCPQETLVETVRAQLTDPATIS